MFTKHGVRPPVSRSLATLPLRIAFDDDVPDTDEGRPMGVVEELERPGLVAWYENISNERWRDELASLARTAFFCDRCGVYVRSGIDNLGQWECEEHFELPGALPGESVFFRVRADHRPPEVHQWTEDDSATILLPKSYLHLFPGDTRPRNEAILTTARVQHPIGGGGGGGPDRGVLQESVRIMRYDAATKSRYTNTLQVFPRDYKNRREELRTALRAKFCLEYPFASPIHENPLVTPRVY